MEPVSLSIRQQAILACAFTGRQRRERSVSHFRQAITQLQWQPTLYSLNAFL